jgi:single-strand DNA-binding protein
MSNPSINTVHLRGSLGMDPELRYTRGGAPLLSFRLSTFRQVAGSSEEAADWHSVVYFGGRAEELARTLVKGEWVDVQGRLSTRSFDDSDGRKRYVTEVVANAVTALRSAEDAAAVVESEQIDGPRADLRERMRGVLARTRGG